MQMAGSGLVSLGIYGALNIAKNWHKNNMRGIVCIYGKSMLCKNLSDQKCYFIDLDELIKDKYADIWEKYRHDEVQYMLNVFPILHKHITVILQNFKNKQIVLVSKSNELIEQLGVDKKKTWCFFPDNQLLNKLPIEEVQKQQLEKVKLLMASKVRKFYCVNTFEDMYRIVRKKLKLKTALNA